MLAELSSQSMIACLHADGSFWSTPCALKWFESWLPTSGRLRIVALRMLRAWMAGESRAGSFIGMRLSMR